MIVNLCTCEYCTCVYMHACMHILCVYIGNIGFGAPEAMHGPEGEFVKKEEKLKIT